MTPAPTTMIRITAILPYPLPAGQPVTGVA